ncbi:MAG: sigma-54-dependent Fis family transcriptional regulator, partial [Desulfobulbaceae bacterium]|nr:sigma-54-dependent Fis family transcriptional regulator [Desulfobulbaceae bacterium]
IEIPPLRDRREDIPLLIDHFIKKYNTRLGIDIDKIDGKCMQILLEYPWPGNVRELENIIERCMALADHNVLTAENLPPDIFRKAEVNAEGFQSAGLSIKKNAKVLERQLISKALEETKGNKTKAAEILEISLPALLYKIKEYKIG